MHALQELLSDPESREALRQALVPPFAAPLVRCAKIKLTPRCNLRCAFCSYWGMRETTELGTDEVCRALDELADLGCAKVHFSGGEATLRPDLPRILAHCVGRGMKANLTTNGTLLTPERAHALVGAGAHGVSLSLDAPDARRHDALRGVPGAFERTLRGIRNLVRARDRAGSRLQLRLNVVLTRHNYQHLPAMVELAADLGMVEVLPMPVDESAREPRHRLSKRDIRHFNTFTAPLAAEGRRRAGFSLAPHMLFPFGRTDEEIRLSARGEYARGHYDGHTCYAPWLHLFLAWNGDAYLCCMARGKTPPLGNVGEGSVAAVFNGADYRAIRERFLAEVPKVCHRCDMFVAENRLIEEALAEEAAGSPVSAPPAPAGTRPARPAPLPGVAGAAAADGSQ